MGVLMAIAGSVDGLTCLVFQVSGLREHGVQKFEQQ
jgi:hypothetical protein